MDLQHYRISFCTSCMGRMDHVQRTLLQNIGENDNYPAAEFLLLDYGSSDGLEEWIRSTAMDHIQTGRLVYVKLEGVTHFRPSHARNVSFLASIGEVVCNVDADNFIKRGFAHHLNEIMHRHPRAMAAFRGTSFSAYGRLAMFRSDFLQVGGYDETFVGYGYEDNDLRARLRVAGCKQYFFDPIYAQAIEHEDNRRIENLPPNEQQKWVTNHRNRWASQQNVQQHLYVANRARWGVAELERNFRETMSTGRS